MRRTLIPIILLLAACTDDDTTRPDTTELTGPELYGADADAQEITTPEGDIVYLQDKAVYGPCALIEPRKDDLAGWLEIDPPTGNTDFGYVCTD